MKVTVTEQSNSQRQIEVTVDAKRVEGAFQKAFKKQLQSFRLPGFRPGKVPASMAQRYITDAGLVRDVISDIVPQAFSEATQEQSLKPISEPEWDLVQNERGKDLIFKASFEISPLLTITDYEGLQITQEQEQINDQHVIDVLDQMRNKHAYFDNLDSDRGIEEGDFATVDYVALQDGVELENSSVTNFQMEMKKDNYVPGFVENLLGLKPGDHKTFELTFPEDYANKDLAGERVAFSFTIHDIKIKKLPELDDDFASSHSPSETLADLKKTIHDRLVAGAAEHAQNHALSKTVKVLVEQVREEDIPMPLRHQHAQRTVQSRMYEMAQHGISLEQVLEARGVSQDEWLQEMLAAGLYEARLEVLYTSLAKTEHIEVSDAEIDKVIAAEAPSHKMKPKQLKAQMRKSGGLDMLASKLLAEKVQKMLMDKVNITFHAPGEAPEAAIKTDESSAITEPPKAKKSKTKTVSPSADAEPANATESATGEAAKASAPKKAAKKLAAKAESDAALADEANPTPARKAKATKKPSTTSAKS